MFFAKKSCLIGMLAAALVVSAGLLHVARAADKEVKPVLTISTGQISAVLDSAEMIAKVFDQAGIVQQFRNQLSGYGLDQNKPVAVSFLATDDGFAPVVMVPVTDVQKLITPLAMQAQMQLEPVKGKKGTFKIDTPTGAVLIVEKGGWATAVMEQQADSLPEDPLKIIAGLDQGNILGIRVDFANTTLEEVSALLAPIQMIALMNPDPQVQRSVEMMDTVLALYFENFSRFTETLSVDAKSGDVKATVEVTTIPDSMMDKAFMQPKDAKTSYIGFFQPKGSVMAFVGASSADTKGELFQQMKKVIKETYDPLVQGLVAQLEENDDERTPYLVPIVTTCYEQYLAMIDLGKGDIAATLFTNATFVGVSIVPDGKKINTLIDDLLKTAKENNADELAKFEIKRDFATEGGFKLSSVSRKVEDDAAPAVVKGKALSLVIGIKDDAICMAGGVATPQELTDLLKKSLDASKTPTAVPETMMVASVKGLGTLAQPFLEGSDADKTAQTIVKALAAADEAAVCTVSQRWGKSLYGMDFRMSGKIWPVIKVLVNEGKQMRQRLSTQQTDVE